MFCGKRGCTPKCQKEKKGGSHIECVERERERERGYMAAEFKGSKA